MIVVLWVPALTPTDLMMWGPHLTVIIIKASNGVPVLAM